MNSISLNHSKQPKSNLTSKQWNGINQLKNNNSIVIKEADKGGAVVIMNKRTLYENGVQPTSRWSDIQEDRPIL